MTQRALAALAAADVLLACSGLSAQEETPAVIVAPNAASRAELARAVSDALGGAPVTLADDALVHDDELVIEPARLLDPAGRRIQGRIMEPPARFRLVIGGSGCVLIRESDGLRIPLQAMRCRSAAEPGR